jgi:MFS family permease
VIGAFAKLLPSSMRLLSFGLGTAAGSFGQFLFSPLAVALIDQLGWQTTLVIFAAPLLTVIPLAFMLSSLPRPRLAGGNPLPGQSARQALAEALGHRSYLLLVLGYFTCGCQLFFITVHLPAYLVDRGLGAEIGGWTIAVIGLFNFIGSIAAGYIATSWPSATCYRRSISAARSRS